MVGGFGLCSCSSGDEVSIAGSMIQYASEHMIECWIAFETTMLEHVVTVQNTARQGDEHMAMKTNLSEA